MDALARAATGANTVRDRTFPTRERTSTVERSGTPVPEVAQERRGSLAERVPMKRPQRAQRLDSHWACPPQQRRQHVATASNLSNKRFGNGAF